MTIEPRHCTFGQLRRQKIGRGQQRQVRPALHTETFQLGLHPLIEGGHRIARDGELPLNTNGGQLSAGRLHGYGFLHEACVQLLGEAGERQVANNPQTAIASSGGGVPGSALLLTAP